MRHRCGVQQRFARHDRIDLGEIVQRHRKQIAVAQHRALRTPGGAAGVEDPGGICAHDIGDGNAVSLFETTMLGRADLDDARLGRNKRRRLEGNARHVLGHEDDRRTRVVENERDLARMQLCVDGNGNQPGMPAGIETGDVIGHVLHQQRNAIALRQAKALLQRCSQRRHRRGEPAVIGNRRQPFEQRRRGRASALAARRRW
ncbi:hypothetical protein ACVWWR_000999 [Bradyrhizobium sp. LM3.2]